MFKKINDIVFSFLEKKNLRKNKEREEIEKTWEKRISPSIKKNTTILSFNKGELIIKAKNPTWRMEISLIKKELKKKLIKTIKLK